MERIFEALSTVVGAPDAAEYLHAPEFEAPEAAIRDQFLADLVAGTDAVPVADGDAAPSPDGTDGADQAGPGA
jgi:hypothetical protein